MQISTHFVYDKISSGGFLNVMKVTVDFEQKQLSLGDIVAMR